jgi:spore coat polysaccharide biosynthesis protein SpsF
MKTALFLQVRLDSSRLPRKALKPIVDHVLAEHAMRALKKLDLDHHVLVTALGDESTLRPYAEACGFEIFAGDRDDVLDRFIRAGRLYEPDLIIRATGDNPLVAIEPAREVLKLISHDPGCDYAAMKGLPLGCGVEIFRREALEKAWAESTDPYDHEHVTPYIYRHPESFTLRYLQNEPPLEHHRVTMDTDEDYRGIRKIFDDLYTGEPVDFNTLKEYLLKS